MDKNVDLFELYQEKFNEPAPPMNFNFKHRQIEEWEEIMEQAIKIGVPYKEQYRNEPNIRY